MVPTSQPSGQPTSQPSSQPTGSPTSNPTLLAAVTRVYENGTTFSLSNRGIHFIDSHTFTHLGHANRRTFLSAFVWDTGFGPHTQQYVEFTVGGLVKGKMHPLVDVNGSSIQCAPKKEGDRGCLSSKWHDCIYNYDVTNYLDSFHGGTLTISVMSHGVLSSACPHIDTTSLRKDPVFIRYEISTEIMPTPEPTPVPTFKTTKGSTVINNNGVELSFGQLGFVSVMQIAFAVAVIFAGIGLGLSKITEHEQCKAYQQKVVKAVIEMGLVGADLINFVFLLLEFMVSFCFFVFFGFLEESEYTDRFLIFSCSMTCT